jgi:pimeloyl-ACP methyl ester carboxylesterase
MEHDLRIGWRKLAVTSSGPARGYPVFLLHGTPGSRKSIGPSDADLAELNIRLITYDRPGYGGSDSLVDRVVAHAADDVRLIADALNLNRFAVLGRSGGGPHALACAALLPHRVSSVASLAGLAPYLPHRFDWLSGMSDPNRRIYEAAMLGRNALTQLLYPEVVALRANPNLFRERLFARAPDSVVADDPAYRDRWLAGVLEAVGRSLEGWASDNLAFTRPWGFEPSAVRVPTLLWHGLRDIFSPVSHARWLAGQIQHAVVRLPEHSSHLDAAAAHHDALRWLARTGRQEALAPVG